jgi:predicted dehydrogenase
LEQWLAAILRDEPMTITVEDGRNLTQLLEAAYTSAREGRAVRF